MPKPSSSTEVVPDPKYERRQRRRFSADQKLQILKEADACSDRGQVAALLRREGLYSSHLTNWRQQLEREGVRGLEPRKAGRKRVHDEKDRRIAELERKNAKLARKLDVAEKVIALQVKAHEILGVALPRIEDE